MMPQNVYMNHPYYGAGYRLEADGIADRPFALSSGQTVHVKG